MAQNSQPTSDPHPLLALSEQLGRLAIEAGKATLPFYHGDCDVNRKADESPVTEADIASHDILVTGLRQLRPDVTLISEENDEHPELEKPDAPFWLIDPLDGTKSFIKRNGEFTVNIALLEKRSPVLGIIYSPISDTLYVGIVGHGAWKTDTNGTRRIHTRDTKEKVVDAVVSLSHLDDNTERYLSDYTIKDRVAASSSIKFCTVAEGKADIYPRFGPTMEWDTAAGQAIVVAAGGIVVHPDGRVFDYTKPDWRNTPFIAAANASLVDIT